jgi:two-component system phosphate regulon sensor histidine kinase PhoR
MYTPKKKTNIRHTGEPLGTELPPESSEHMRRRNLEKYSELDAVFTNMVEAVVVVDESGRITNLNRAAACLLHLDMIGAIGQFFTGVIENRDMYNLMQNIFQSQVPVEREIILVNEKNEHLFIQAHGVLISEQHLNTKRALMVFNDVTKLRRLESIRSDFVANVSHELKTPITTIKGFIETLRDGTVDDQIEARHFLDIISKNADRLHAIVEDLLTLSRVEEDDKHSRIVLRNEPVEKPLAAAIESCSPRALKKGIRFSFSCPGTISAPINAPLLEQAVTNLIVNAIKYSDEDTTIMLHVDMESEFVIIKVKDNGIGIQKEHLPRLFERFYRSDKARSRKLGGTGLGLAIVKHIVSAHRGKIEVESEVGKGTTFTLKLPVDNNRTIEKDNQFSLKR